MSVLTQKRLYLDQITTLAISQTVEITNLLRNEPVPIIAQELRRTMPAVSNTYATASAVVSATAYNESRALANPPSTYEATPEIIDTNTSMQAAIGFGVAQLTTGKSYDIFQSTLAGSVQRLVMEGDRKTVDFNIVTDPDGTRYERVPSANACAFCMTMAAVATDNDNLKSNYFDKYHNFCRCTINPVFTGQPLTNLPEYKKARDAYSLADQQLQKEKAEARRLFDIEREAQGLPTGGSKATTAFERANPDLSLTTENILKKVRQITGQK
jgi:hypothetical protein